MDGKQVKNKSNPTGTGKFLNESGEYETPVGGGVSNSDVFSKQMLAIANLTTNSMHTGTNCSNNNSIKLNILLCIYFIYY